MVEPEQMSILTWIKDKCLRISQEYDKCSSKDPKVRLKFKDEKIADKFEDDANYAQKIQDYFKGQEEDTSINQLSIRSLKKIKTTLRKHYRLLKKLRNYAKKNGGYVLRDHHRSNEDILLSLNEIQDHFKKFKRDTSDIFNSNNTQDVLRYKLLALEYQMLYMKSQQTQPINEGFKIDLEQDSSFSDRFAQQQTEPSERSSLNKNSTRNIVRGNMEQRNKGFEWDDNIQQRLFQTNKKDHDTTIKKSNYDRIIQIPFSHKNTASIPKVIQIEEGTKGDPATEIKKKGFVTPDKMRIPKKLEYDSENSPFIGEGKNSKQSIHNEDSDNIPEEGSLKSLQKMAIEENKFEANSISKPMMIKVFYENSNESQSILLSSSVKETTYTFGYDEGITEKIKPITYINVQDEYLSIKQFKITFSPKSKCFSMTCCGDKNLTLYQIPNTTFVKLHENDLLLLSKTEYFVIKECSYGEDDPKAQERIKKSFSFYDPRESSPTRFDVTGGRLALECIGGHFQGKVFVFTPKNQDTFSIGRNYKNYLKYPSDKNTLHISGFHCFLKYEFAVGWYIKEFSTPSSGGTSLVLNSKDRKLQGLESIPIPIRQHASPMSFEAGDTHIIISEEENM